MGSRESILIITSRNRLAAGKVDDFFDANVRRQLGQFDQGFLVVQPELVYGEDMKRLIIKKCVKTSWAGSEFRQCHGNSEFHPELFQQHILRMLNQTSLVTLQA